MGEGHDCTDAGGRATQEAKAEDEGGNKIEVLAFQITLTPTFMPFRVFSQRERGSGMAMGQCYCGSDPRVES